MTYSIDQARRDYKPLMQRGQLLQMFERFGIREWAARKLIAATDAAGAPVLPAAPLPGCKRAHYARDKALALIDSILSPASSSQ